MPKKTKKTQAHRKSSTTGWKIEELQKLIEGVKRYRITDYERIQKLVPTRTVAQVEAFLKMAKVSAQVERSKQKTNAANNGVRQKVEKEAPIESWLDLAWEIVHYETEDYSKMMGVVLSMISHYEEFPEPQSPLEPDYRKIYRYLSALLDDGELPALNQIESSVVLGLMEELQEQLRGQLDLGLHRKLLLWKYSKLNDKVDLTGIRHAISCSRQVFSNDFSQIVPIPDLPRPPESSSGPRVTLDEVLQRIFQRNSAEQQEEPMAASASAAAPRQQEAGRRQDSSLPRQSAELFQTQNGTAQERRGLKRKRATADRGLATETTTLANSHPLPTDQPSCSAILVKDNDASKQETSSQSRPSHVNDHSSSSSSFSADPVEEEEEKEEHPCPTFYQEAQYVSNEEGTCELLHWRNPGYELHLVHNPITASTRAEPCCCTRPRKLLPRREEDWPLFFYESELAELRRLSGQSKSRKHRPAGPSDGAGEAGESTSERIWDFGEERSYQRGKRGRQPVHPELRTMKKPKLLTLNPFHIPVEMIKLKKRQRGGSSNKPKDK